jgi:glyoxylase-like metal-dependent hydrolase (beta-lactamase superfamily II)
MTGTRAVYGEERTAALYGEVVPVAAERVEISTDSMTIHLGQRPLKLIHTPGHARHHHVVWDELSRTWLTGDAFGISYPEFNDDQGRRWGFPSCTPVQFDPTAMAQSIRRMLDFGPVALCPTHFGRIAPTEAVKRHAEQVLDQIDRLARGALALSESEHTPERLQALVADTLIESAQANGSPLALHDRERALSLLQADIDLNAQGIGIWLSRLGAQRGASPA